jgi:hypothetical protein
MLTRKIVALLATVVFSWSRGATAQPRGRPQPDEEARHARKSSRETPARSPASTENPQTGRSSFECVASNFCARWRQAENPQTGLGGGAVWIRTLSTDCPVSKIGAPIGRRGPRGPDQREPI